MLRSIVVSLSFLLISTGCFYACRSKEVYPPEHAAIAALESVRTLDDITLTADSVNVFICPENAYCIAPNNARVKLRLSKNTITHSVRLWTFIPNYNLKRSVSQVIDSASVEFDRQLYKIILRNGQYRRVSKNEATPEVIVQVSRL